MSLYPLVCVESSVLNSRPNVSSGIDPAATQKPQIKKEDKRHTGTNFRSSSDLFNDDAGPRSQHVAKKIARRAH